MESTSGGRGDDPRIKEKLEQYERLKSEFETLSNDHIAERRARSCFQTENTELLQLNQQLEQKVESLQRECEQKTQVVEELERRRDMAKKEIKQLYAKLQKKEQPSDHSKVVYTTNPDLNIAGLLKLKIFKRDLAAFYK